MQVAGAYAAGSPYGRVAQTLCDLGARTVLDVGCADGVLRRALPSTGPWLVGLDAAVALLREHPPPVPLQVTKRGALLVAR